MSAVKLRRIGKSVGVVLPDEVLARLRVGEGDTLHLREIPGGIGLTPQEFDFESQMAVARRVMTEDRDILGELAK